MSRAEQATAKLRRYAGELAAAEKAAGKARAKVHEWIVKAVDAGVKPAEVARVAGVSPGRVSQVAPVAKVPGTPIHAQENGARNSCDAGAGTVPGLPDTGGPMVSGVASTRQRRRYGRATVFRAPVPVAELLAEVPADAGSVRVFLTGAAPVDPAGGASRAEQVRGWALADPGEGWSAESHYLADPDLPVLRFRHADGRKVTILRAAAWWGETDADPATCRAAWSGLETALDQVPAFAGAGLADTPATTGRALWMRTIPEGRNYPVLSTEVRELLSATSGQGRIELRPGAGTGHDFAYVDGRFMYAPLTWGMPVGAPRRWTAGEAAALADDPRGFTSAMRGRGRWRITCQVPEGWAHLGMFMAPDGAGGWCYPDQPGQRFTTWADGSEVWAAMSYGWEPIIHEGITWAEGKPLDAWRDALLSVWQRANASEAPPARLAARAVRMVMLSTIGAFATRSHPVTHSAPLDDDSAVPPGAEVRRVGDRLVWQTPATLSAWSEACAHPEWSATVWARARTRLLTGRGVGQERVGALHLPAERVVALSTDALYLAGGAPGWADDGRPGRFRVKGIRPGGFDWPTSWGEVYRMRDEAEAAGHGQ